MGAHGKQLQPGWYVVQVSTGREERMCAAIARACAERDGVVARAYDRVCLRECFSPRFASRRKWKGEWQDVDRPLLPGYVVADVENPVALADVLRGMHDFCRLLALDEAYSPLDDRERAWVESQTTPRDRVIPLSFGYKEGDRLFVNEGPLAGNEMLITKLDRKNCLAHIEFHTGQITLKTTVGLVIMPSGKVRVEY